MWRKRNGRRAGKYEREKKERGDSCEKTTCEIAGGQNGKGRIERESRKGNGQGEYANSREEDGRICRTGILGEEKKIGRMWEARKWDRK